MELKDLNIQQRTNFFDCLRPLGLYTDSRFGVLSVAYGIDNPLMEYRGIDVKISTVLNNIEDVGNITTQSLKKAFVKSATLPMILKEHRADYENACDYLYYGEHYSKWRESNKEYLSDEHAKYIWKCAFNHMANAD